MLTIYRFLEESIYIGDKKMTLKGIQDRSVIVEIDKKTFRIKHGQNISIGTTDIFLLKMLGENKVEFGFEGPRSTNILRGELYEKGNIKYIDNSTKQFPSGDF